MGQGFLIDTNILIDAQTRKLPEHGIAFLTDVINRDFTISFITYIEFLGYKHATPAMEEFISLAQMIEINKPIIDMTIVLRKSIRIQLPDAIIAATALTHNLTLVTRNVADFQTIKQLTVINPWDK
jgi:predicted nucleic acid-binding protein